jgi:hypothetical protein
VIAKTRGQLHAVFIITEYAAGGDLLKLLLRPDTPLGWKVQYLLLLLLLLLHSTTDTVRVHTTATSNTSAQS